MNRIELHSLCVKIILFLDKNKKMKKNELLYLISLSDFYNNGTMLSKNIKNINSLNYYMLGIKDAIALLLATDLINFYDVYFELSVTGIIFAHKLSQNIENKLLLEKIEYINNKFNCNDKLYIIYDELVMKFINKKLGAN